MQKAIDETNRRRKIQQSFNEEHGITPTSIQKPISDLLNLGKSVEPDQSEWIAKAAKLTPKALSLQINQLEQQMYHYAKNLEFEAAAHCRDTVALLREQLLTLS